MGPAMPPRERRQRGSCLAWGAGAWRLAWPFLAAALVLLLASEVIWLWHSWPVRELLDTEQIAPGGGS
jgi:hypothetical protein